VSVTLLPGLVAKAVFEVGPVELGVSVVVLGVVAPEYVIVMSQEAKLMLS
jgi:hypothetical protein